MFDRISINPDICHGKPCIKGTRIMILIILGLLEEGFSFEQIIDEYPELEKADIAEAIHYAKAIIENEQIELVTLA
ncbi:MAG: DUF433 domain-containing protein [PVC group bacterium]